MAVDQASCLEQREEMPSDSPNSRDKLVVLACGNLTASSRSSGLLER
jgi:hypothetical protein